MCKTKAQGGQRCPADSLADYTKATRACRVVEDARRSGQASDTDVAAAQHKVEQHAIEYASTLEGSNALRAEVASICEYDANDDLARDGIRRINAGAQMAQTNRATENVWRAQQGMGPLTTPVPLTIAQEVAAQREKEAEVARAAAHAADPFGLRGSADSAG